MGGPATVIAWESKGRYFLSWRGRILLVATTQMRYATMEENAAAAVIAQETAKTGNQTDDKKAYVDATRVEEEPKPTRRVRKMHLKQKKQLQEIEDRKEEQRLLRLQEIDKKLEKAQRRVTRKPPTALQDVQPAPIRDAPTTKEPNEDDKLEQTPDDMVQDPDEDISDLEEELGMPPALGQLKRRASKGQEEALDDVPLQFKRSKYQDEPTGVE